LGENSFALRVVTSDGEASSLLKLTHRPENADQLPAPSLELLSPVSGALLNQSAELD
jgi:hypothetical protein